MYMKKNNSHHGLGDRIKLRLEKMGKDQTWLAHQIKVGQPAISQIIKRDATKHLLEIAQALGVNVEWLRDGTHNSKSNNVTHLAVPPQTRDRHFPLNVDDLVPMYGAVSASSPEIVHFTEEYMIEEVPRHPSVQKVKGAFAMLVAGDSMAPRHMKGEKVYIHPYQVPSIGQDCIVVKEPDGNAILKQFRGETKTDWKFSQLNPAKEFSISKANVRKIFAVVR